MRALFGIFVLAVLCVLAVRPLPAQDGFPRTVTDLTGVPVDIPARPALVAVSGSVPALAQIVPPDALRTVDPAGLPDWTGVGLLVLSEIQAAGYPSLVDSARAAGVPIFQITLISSLDGWRDAVERLGRAAGHEDRAGAILGRLDRRLDAVRALVKGQTPVHALVLTPEGYTFGTHTLITDLIVAAGGINTAAEAGYADFRQIDDSAIRTLAPDVFLLSPAWTPDQIAAFAADSASRVVQMPFSPTLPPDPGAAAVALAILFHPAALLLP